MGCEDSITAEGGPMQCDTVGRRVRVCFHYDTSKEVGGTIVRDDGEMPLRTIIRLDDGRYLLTTECQWSIAEHSQSAAPLLSDGPAVAEKIEIKRDAVLSIVDKMMFGRTDAHAAKQWERCVEAIDALIAAVRSESSGQQETKEEQNSCASLLPVDPSAPVSTEPLPNSDNAAFVQSVIRELTQEQQLVVDLYTRSNEDARGGQHVCLRPLGHGGNCGE